MIGFRSYLYNALFDWLGQPGDWAHLGHLTTSIWLVIAVIHTGSVSLPKWVAYVPCSGKFAQSIQRRIQHWLYNPRINIHRLYKPLIQAALANWKDKDIFLALDTSLFWNESCLVRRCVVYRGRAFPVVWRVLSHRSASVSFEEYQAMIVQAVRRLPNDKRVVLLADRGFIHSKLMGMLSGRCAGGIFPRHTSLSMVNFGQLPVMNPPLSQPFKNMDCASILRRILGMTNPMAGTFNALKFALWLHCLVCGLS